MTRPRADVGEAELLQKLSDLARMKVDAEPLSDEALEVDAPPAHDAVDLTGPTSTIFANWARCSSDRRGFGPFVQLSNRPSGPEALKRWIQSRSVCRVHAPDLRRPASIHPAQNRGQREKPAALVDGLRPAGQPAQLLRRIVLSQSDR